MRAGPPRRGPSRYTSQGFTLVEILLVLALLALAGAVFLPAAGAIFARGRMGNAEEAVAIVLQQVRREAVLHGRPLALRFDAEAQRFLWDDAAGASVGTAGTPVKVEFLRPRAGSAILIGGQLVETALVPVLKFFPDGTCDAVRVQVRAGREAARIMVIDPWTCAPGLEVQP